MTFNGKSKDYTKRAAAMLMFALLLRSNTLAALFIAALGAATMGGCIPKDSNPDAAISDLVTTTDLMQDQDLAGLADLSVLRDFVSQSDMAQPDVTCTPTVTIYDSNRGCVAVYDVTNNQPTATSPFYYFYSFNPTWGGLDSGNRTYYGSIAPGGTARIETRTALTTSAQSGRSQSCSACCAAGRQTSMGQNCDRVSFIAN